MKSACEIQWEAKGVAYPLHLAGWKPTADKQGIFAVKGRLLRIVNSWLTKQQWRIRKQNNKCLHCSQPCEKQFCCSDCEKAWCWEIDQVEADAVFAWKGE